MLIVVTDLNLWLVFFLGPFFLSPCCKTDRFCWTADKFWFGGIVSSLVGCIKADQTLISQIAACSTILSTLLHHRLLLNYSLKESTLLLLWCSIYCCSTISKSTLLHWCCSLLSLLLAQHTSIGQPTGCFSVLHTLPCSKLWSASLYLFLLTSTRSALLNSALVMSAHFFYSRLNSTLLCYFTLPGAKCLCCHNRAK